MKNIIWLWRLFEANQTLHGSIFNLSYYRLKRDLSIKTTQSVTCCEGISQCHDVDFFETFNLVAKASSVRVILSIVVIKGWSLHQLYFNNVFLNGSINEDVYMAQPSGYVSSTHPTYVYKLKKVIYNLK